MPATRPRRIVRRAAMALAGFVLAAVAYASSVLGLSVAYHADWLPAWVGESGALGAYITPMWAYALDPDMPGSPTCTWLLSKSAAYGWSMNAKYPGRRTD